jgi:hypothetical protein
MILFPPPLSCMGHWPIATVVKSSELRAMSDGLYLRLSGEPPMPPPDADFSFRIVFEKGSRNPRRIFDAASELIDGFEALGPRPIKPLASV